MYLRKILAALAATTVAPTTMSDSVEVQLHEVESQQLDATVPVAVLLPPGYDPQQQLPLLVSLDGGVGDRMTLVKRKALYAEMFATQVLPPLIVASFSGGSNQFYHGPWEDWITSELPQWAHDMLGANVDADNLLLTGMSGGGNGTLKIGFRSPNRFKAIAAMESNILASLEWPKQFTRQRWWLPDVTVESIWGSPLDPSKFLADHPPNIAIKNAANIKKSSMNITWCVGLTMMASVLMTDLSNLMHS